MPKHYAEQSEFMFNPNDPKSLRGFRLKFDPDAGHLVYETTGKVAAVQTFYNAGQARAFCKKQGAIFVS